MTNAQLIVTLRDAGFTAGETIHIIATYISMPAEKITWDMLRRYIPRWKEIRKEFITYAY